MKTQLLSLLFLTLTFAGCKEKIKLDVKNIHQVNNTEQWNITIDRSELSASELNADRSCKTFNNELEGLVNGIQASFMEQAKESFDALDSIGEKPIGPYELIVKDTVFMADENFISVRVLSYEFLGGAHGMTNFYGINYDVKTQKFLNKKEILNYDKANEINALLKANLQDPDKCFTMEAPTIDNFTALNLTPKTVDFTYAQYILGPYSCGYTTISVPREKLKDMLLIK